MAAKLVSGKSKAGGEDGIDAKLSQLVEARDDEGEQEAFRRGVIENICGKMLQVGIDLKETETHTHRQTDIQRDRERETVGSNENNCKDTCLSVSV